MVSDQHEEKNIQYMPVQMMPLTPGDEVDLLELWQTLMRRRWIIVGVAVVCILAGVGYALLATPKYEVRMFLAPGTIGFNGDQLPMKASSITEMKEWFESGAYLPDLIKHYGMEAVENGTIPYEKKGLSVDLPKDTRMLTLSLKSSTPDLSKEVLQYIIRIFAEQEKNYPAAKAHMEKRIFDLTQQLEGWDFKRSRLDDDIVKTIRQRKILDANLVTLDTHIAEQKNIIRRMEKQVDTINANTQELMVLRKTMLKAKTDQLSELMYANFVQQNIAYSANLEQRVDALRADINNQAVKRKELLDKMKNVDLLINDKKEKQTKELVLQKQNIEKLLALATVQLSQLSPVEIIQEPFSSIKPVAPRKVLIIVLAAVGGLFLGIFVAFILAFMQKVEAEEA